MKSLTAILIIAILAIGCKKKDAARTVATTDGKDYGFPTWRADTLKSYRLMGGYDSIVTYLSGDTSLINYHGQKLYAYYVASPIYHLSDSSEGYAAGTFIGPNCFDTTTFYSSCIISSPHYWDASHNMWVNGLFEIVISNLHPHFDTSVNGYYY